MEIVGQTASLSFNNEASSSAREQRPSSKGDIDFDDVFGGPPTWTRYSYGGYRMQSWEETTISPTGSVERPVFGERHSSPRTRTSDDLFDDGLGRSDESVGLPRWHSPTLGSSVLRSAECVDIPIFGSHVNTQNNNHLSRISTSDTQTLRNDSGQSAGQTLLSREYCSVTRSIEKGVDHKSKARTGSSSIEFHFSMHKWANVGVPLLMSLHEGKHPGSSKVSALSVDNMSDFGFPDEDLSAPKQDMNLASGKKKLEAKKVSSSIKGEANKSRVGSPKNLVKGMVKCLFKTSDQESPPRTKTNKAKEETIRKLDDISFQDDASTTSGSVTKGSKAGVQTVDDEPSLDRFWVEELAPVDDKLSTTQQESDAIMALDSKIHMWSCGRTNNIHSLLSTIQLVLWAESGWKPVAIDDITEVNALTKSYNQAMLCLHPYKFQQKGTDSRKRYIAEKVLHILQEAWDHFNSVGGAVL